MMPHNEIHCSCFKNECLRYCIVVCTVHCALFIHQSTYDKTFKYRSTHSVNIQYTTQYKNILWLYSWNCTTVLIHLCEDLLEVRSISCNLWKRIVSSHFSSESSSTSDLWCYLNYRELTEFSISLCFSISTSDYVVSGLSVCLFSLCDFGIFIILLGIILFSQSGHNKYWASSSMCIKKLYSYHLLSLLALKYIQH